MNNNQKEELLRFSAALNMMAMMLPSNMRDAQSRAIETGTPVMKMMAKISINHAYALVDELERERKEYVLIFLDAKFQRPEHLQRCLCWDSFEKGYRCYVYDDISKYWCTQATTEHDPNGDNHVSDYADNRITHWSHLPKEER